ncbi:MAG: ABC transporter substrate-binding protein [Mariprofundales bacterium]
MMAKIFSLVVVSCLSVAAWMPLAAASESGPKQIVAMTVQSIIDVLKQRQDPNTLSEDERQQIRDSLNGRFDFHEMARRSLGKPWRSLDGARRQEFVGLFRQMMEYTYGNRLSSYHGQTIAYDDAEFKRKKARVKSRVIDQDKTTPVAYRLLQTKAGWQIYDIKIEGVSMVGTFRKDFRGVVERDGVDGLFVALQDKVKKLIAKSRNN